MLAVRVPRPQGQAVALTTCVMVCGTGEVGAHREELSRNQVEIFTLFGRDQLNDGITDRGVEQGASVQILLCQTALREGRQSGVNPGVGWGRAGKHREYLEQYLFGIAQAHKDSIEQRGYAGRCRELGQHVGYGPA